MAPRSKRALEKAIEDDKQKLQDAIDRLGGTVKEEVDPRVRVANSPYAAIGVTFSIGFVVGLISLNR